MSRSDATIRDRFPNGVQRRSVIKELGRISAVFGDLPLTQVVFTKTSRKNSYRAGILGESRRLVQSYVDHYNYVRLNSATGYHAEGQLAGPQQEIHAERDRKLEAARKQRQVRLQQAA